MSRDDDYTTENLLGYLYHQKYFKLIGIYAYAKIYAYLLNIEPYN